MATETRQKQAYVGGIRCPLCGGRATVRQTKKRIVGQIRRKRCCVDCGQPVQTVERIISPASTSFTS